MINDIRDILFRSISDKRFHAVLTSERAGVLAGTKEAVSCMKELGINFDICKKDGEDIGHSESFANFSASPKQIAMAEEVLVGTLAKASGIATASRTAVMLADGRIKIVSGAWKKMPPDIKELVRNAVAAGGASFRICEPPMLYIDKNFIRMLGSVEDALTASSVIDDTTKIVQLRGELASIPDETVHAVRGGAAILMVDTGRIEDMRVCQDTLLKLGVRSNVRLAFAGNVELKDIPSLADAGVDILDIGKKIVDAPLLDMRLDVIGED